MSSWVEQVGRPIDRASVSFDSDKQVITLQYTTRVKKIRLQDAVEGYGALPAHVMRRSWWIEAELMERFARAADEYAHTNFHPTVLSDYYAVSSRRNK